METIADDSESVFEVGLTEQEQLRHIAQREEDDLPNGVFTLLTDCYSPTCTRDHLCYRFRPRWAGQYPRLPVHPGPFSGFGTSAESFIESRFLAGPDAKLAGEHLRILTQAPHMAGTPEDKATAAVAQKFRDAGLETEIVEYKVWMNLSRGN